MEQELNYRDLCPTNTPIICLVEWFSSNPARFPKKAPIWDDVISLHTHCHTFTIPPQSHSSICGIFSCHLHCDKYVFHHLNGITMYSVANQALHIKKNSIKKLRQKSLPLVSSVSANYACRMPSVSQIRYLIYVSHEYLYFEAKWFNLSLEVQATV